jgi:phage host-nuclease inhibitor protein Gam
MASGLNRRIRMPLTAKLSRRFYEKFGDEPTNELVDLLNSMDATYQTSMRELNEANFARFDAKMEQRIAGVEARIAGVETRLDAKIEGLEAKLGARMESLSAELREELVTRIAASESHMIRWMVTLWSSSILATVGLMFALLKSR